jgi:hypothetical protein
MRADKAAVVVYDPPPSLHTQGLQHFLNQLNFLNVIKQISVAQISE